MPTQANLSDCVDKGVLSLTAAGAQRVAQHRASAMGVWHAFLQPPAATVAPAAQVAQMMATLRRRLHCASEAGLAAAAAAATAMATP